MVFVVGAANAAQGGQAVVHFWGDYIRNVNTRVSAGNRLFRNDDSHFGLGNRYYNLDLDGDGATDDSRIVYEFSMSNMLNPVQFDAGHPSFEYRINDPGARFYGGIQAAYLNVQQPNIHQPFVQYEGADFNRLDTASGRPIRSSNPESPQPSPYTGEIYESYSEITLFTYHPADHTANHFSSFQAAFLWRADEFINVASGDSVQFDASSRLAITTTRKWFNIQDSRFAVQDGDGTFYVSEPWQGAASLTGFDVIESPVEMTWAVWEPSVNPFDFAFHAEDATFAPRTFSDIQSVGVYLAANTFTNFETKLVFDQFQVVATVRDEFGVPRPNVVGDYNGDNIVDDRDYRRWKWEFGAPVLNAGFGVDGSGDGYASAADYTLWRDNLSASGLAAGHQGKSIPEPSSSILGLIGVGAVWAGLYRVRN